MTDIIITKPNGQRFRLTGGHTSTAPVGGESTKHPDCEGCGTKRKTA